MAQHRGEVVNMGAEARCRLLDVLHIPNVRKYAVENGQRAPGVHGNRQTALVHDRQEPRSLQRGGLAAHVWSRYHQPGPSRPHVYVDRHRLASEQRVPRVGQANGVAPSVHGQGRGLAPGPVPGARHDEVQPGRGFDARLDLGRRLAHCRRQLPQYALRLTLLLQDQLAPAVPHLHGREGFDEQRRARVRCPVHNPGNPVAMPGFHLDDEPVRTNGDHAVL